MSDALAETPHLSGCELHPLVLQQNYGRFYGAPQRSVQRKSPEEVPLREHLVLLIELRQQPGCENSTVEQTKYVVPTCRITVCCPAI